MHPKNKSNTDEKYLKWIRAKKCMLCGTTKDVEAHHMFTARHTDLLAVPLCVGCHRTKAYAYHVLKHDAWEKRHNIESWHHVVNYLMEYIEHLKEKNEDSRY